jgi:hypothetical protein
VKTIEAGLKACPRNLREALQGEDSAEWQQAADLEFDTLTQMGVIDHGYTIDEVTAAGITKKPIKFSVALDNKYIDGVLERRKVRMAVAGHKYNMQKGIDYQEVFAPAPNENTARLMQAMTCMMNLKRKAWNIKLAYCWADLPSDQMIALEYPEGYQRHRKTPNGNEKEYIILRKNCYGLPQAGKLWSDHRDQFMMTNFNKGHWECHKCTYDPCLFYITRGDRVREDNKSTLRQRPFKEEAWVSIHTDDCDSYGTGKTILNDIYDAINTKWKAKLVDPGYMLGIKRERKEIKDHNGTVKGIEITMTMQPYIEGMYNRYKEYMSENFKPATPFPVGLALSKHEHTSSEESQKVLDRGYLSLVGGLLWAARGCCPTCQTGCNQLGSVMSKPSEQAWEAGIHMVKWMYDNKTKGIRFYSEAAFDEYDTMTYKEAETRSIKEQVDILANMQAYRRPVVFSDASNKPDPHDGLSRYGYACMMAGAPIATSSKKLCHVGLSAMHNEYMAARHAASSAVWISQLLTEIGLTCVVNEPIRLYGDNLAANKTAQESFVSTGNQYIYLPYHWIREIVQRGIIAVKYVNTKFNVSDLMTKSVTRQTIVELHERLTGYCDTIQWYRNMLNDERSR